MAPEVVHWEVTGKDGAALQKYYGDLFGWEFNTDNPMNYGSVGSPEDGLTGGIGSAADGSPGMATFYVGVEDVAGYLEKATSLGGSVIVPEMQVMDQVIIGLFADPEGHVVGLVKSLQQ